MQTHKKNSSCRFWISRIFIGYLSSKGTYSTYTTEVPIFEKYNFQVVRSTWPCQIEDGKPLDVGVGDEIRKIAILYGAIHLVDKLKFLLRTRGRDHRLYF
jgi:hypothetical protein